MKNYLNNTKVVLLFALIDYYFAQFLLNNKNN